MCVSPVAQPLWELASAVKKATEGLAKEMAKQVGKAVRKELMALVQGVWEHLRRQQPGPCWHS